MTVYQLHQSEYKATRCLTYNPAMSSLSSQEAMTLHRPCRTLQRHNSFCPGESRITNDADYHHHHHHNHHRRLSITSPTDRDRIMANKSPSPCNKPGQNRHDLPIHLRKDCESVKQNSRLQSVIPNLNGLYSLLQMTCVFYVLCFYCSTVCVSGHPVAGIASLSDRYPGHHEFEYQPLPFDSTNYLSKFGYLPKSDMETGAIRNKSELTKAVKKFQRMAHLPVTGELDSPTVEKMLRPRCGVTDDLEEYFTSGKSDSSRSKRYVLGPSTWPHKNLTYRYLSYTSDLQSSETRDAIERAFKLWSDATELTFKEIYHGEADIMIKFAHMYHQDGYPFDGPGMTLAHAFFPGPDNGGDAHFDEDEHWTVGTDQGVNLFTVAAHEFGHSLGLGHSSVFGSLMYPWYQSYNPDLTLHYDDLIAIQYLYGVGQPQPPTQRPTPRPTPRPTHIPTQSPTQIPTQTPTRRPTDTTTTSVIPRTSPTIPPAFTTRPPQRPTTMLPGSKPNPCSTNIDAVALIRQEVYLFKGRWFWRLDKNGLMVGYPVELERFWYYFPDDLEKIDAVYERVNDGKIVFFSGRRFWLFTGNKMDTGFPREGRPLTDMGFPDSLESVDAAFVWGYNGRTYFVTGNMYWRYDENLGRMDYDYPRDMSMWSGVPVPVDAAFQLWDGNTYFFQGLHFWKFKDQLMRIDEDRFFREPIGTFWLDCAHSIIIPTEPVVGSSTGTTNTRNGLNIHLLFIISLLSLLLCTY